MLVTWWLIKGAAWFTAVVAAAISAILAARHARQTVDIPTVPTEPAAAPWRGHPTRLDETVLSADPVESDAPQTSAVHVNVESAAYRNTHMVSWWPPKWMLRREDAMAQRHPLPLTSGLHPRELQARERIAAGRAARADLPRH